MACQRIAALTAHHVRQPFQVARFLHQRALGSDGLHIHTNAHTHGAGHRHLAQVNTFAGGRFCLGQGIHQSGQVTLQLVVVKRATANGGVNDTGFVNTELNLTGLALRTAPATSGVTVPTLGFGIKPRGPRI